MTVRRWAAIATCAALAGLTGCAPAAESPVMPTATQDAPTSEAPTQAGAWQDPLPGAGPELIAAQYPALEPYELEAYNFMRPVEPPQPELDYSETVVWMAEGEAAQLASDFATEPLDASLELISDWPSDPPGDLESSTALTDAFRMGWEEEITVAVSPGSDLVFIVTEGDESAGPAVSGPAEG